MIPKLLITADDFTGALDTGVQLAKDGISTRAVSAGAAFEGAEVIVVNTESRHLPKDKAEETVMRITGEAVDAGIKYFYKKTDSALRGNVASELFGMLAASGQESLYFVPAYPAMNRVTRKGVHYVDGVRVSQSVFGSDPHEPVKESDIRKLLDGGGVRVSVCSAKDTLDKDGIIVFDAQTENDLLLIARRMKECGARVFAGCAGFAACLSDIIDFERTEKRRPELKRGLAVITASVNPVSIEQFRVAKSSGFFMHTLTKGQKTQKEFPLSDDFSTVVRELAEEFHKTGRIGIRSVSEAGEYTVFEDGEKEIMRRRISDNIGAVAAALIREIDTNFFIVGGDVLQAALVELGVSSVVPMDQPQPGVVSFEIYLDKEKRTIFSKSGGFGGGDSIIKIEEYIRRNGYERE